MTIPAQHNPYGVFVPRSRQSLPHAPARPMDDHPLVPWDDTSHIEQWVDVDHAQEQLDAFRLCLDRLPELVNDGVDHGRLVVVTGPAGMGKTTLIHRCVHEARQYIAQLAPEAEGEPAPLTDVVAMAAGYDNNGKAISTDENGDFASTPAINSTIRDKVVAALGKHFTNLDPAISQEAPAKAFSAISTLLFRQDALLFVIVPHIDWRDAGVRTKFLKTCLKHAQSRIVLFVEISHGTDEPAAEVVKELLPHPAVTHLALERLREEDRARFSRSARSGHPDPDHTLLNGWNPADVRELRQVYHATAERQIREGRPVRITADELREHTGGLDLATLRRDPPPAHHP
ncbi:MULTISPECIES: hypothetical protein [Streptomyces]|uniref:hypothetical protein n=1 Tax=Streptomyces TaxID=1883 RepID=UPI001317219A|nr:MULTISPECIES: hypothetical protein [Streptomyces]QGZ51555.1 hypothetical protein GPZ77_27075 [Streptomyces sp. QHH-9511]GGT98341.1 hypothetical protein GCM10010272_49030 [Streptomyces lateritius]